MEATPLIYLVKLVWLVRMRALFIWQPYLYAYTVVVRKGDQDVAGDVAGRANCRTAWRQAWQWC